MSYSAQPGNPGDYSTTFSFSPTTPMILDIQALQQLYGANNSYHAGADTYSFSDATTYHQTIWDGGGTDNIQYSGYYSCTIDLHAGAGSAIGRPVYVLSDSGAILNAVKNVWIAYGVTIENAVGGSGNDTITGNDANNSLDGGPGNDTLYGGAGSDTFDWNPSNRGGNDVFYGGPGDDVFVLDSPVDTVIEYPGEGNDTVWVSFNYSISQLANIENIRVYGLIGVVITGNSANNVIVGSSGNDTLSGGAGIDTLDGGDGIDIATDSGNRSGYTVARYGTVYFVTDIDPKDGNDGTDSLTNIERITFADTSMVLGVNNAPAGIVAVSGTTTQNQTLSASNTLADADGLGAISYQWKANNVIINGATNNTFVLTEAQVGKTVVVVATYTDGLGTAESVSSSSTGVIANLNDAPVGSVSISGNVIQNQSLTVFNNLADADGLGAISYRWQISTDGTIWSDLSSGTTLGLSEAQVGKSILVQASYTDGRNTLEVVTSSATTIVANVNDLPSGGVIINGSPAVNQTLTALNTLADADGLGTISYQWTANGNNISGATASTLTLTAAQGGKSISVVATYTDGHGTVESVSSGTTHAVLWPSVGTTGADTLQCGLGNDTIDGGGGIDTVVYSSNKAAIAHNADGTFTVGTNVLKNVERIQFADTKLALDLDGNAGTTAKILGAVFGPTSIANKEYVGIGLGLLDGGMNYSDLMQLALNAAGATTHSATVDLLWTNLFGPAPTPAQAKPYVEMLDSGSVSVTELGIAAGELDLNKTNIHLVGLQQTGLEYS